MHIACLQRVLHTTSDPRSAFPLFNPPSRKLQELPRLAWLFRSKLERARRVQMKSAWQRMKMGRICKPRLQQMARLNEGSQHTRDGDRHSLFSVLCSSQ